MDIRQLRYFVATARAGTITRAAFQLRLTQPALSRQLKALEEEMGTALFARDVRGTRLTNSGAKLLERAQAVIEQFDQVKDQIRSDTEPVTGSVTIGISTGIGETIIPPLIQRYRALYPAVRIHIRQAFSGVVEEALRDRLVDLAVLPAASQRRLNVNVRPLLKENLCLIGPHEPPLDTLRKCTFKRAATFPLLMPAQPNRVRALVEQIAHQERVHLRIDVEVDGLGPSALRELLCRGLGYAIMPAHQFRADIHSGTLVAVPISHPQAIWTISLVTAKGLILSRAAQAMADLLQETVRNLLAQDEWQHATLL